LRTDGDLKSSQIEVAHALGDELAVAIEGAGNNYFTIITDYYPHGPARSVAEKLHLAFPGTTLPVIEVPIIASVTEQE
jgi:hypothetical protein